ncbi:MAG: hypothetical protein K2Y37_14455 [Pirellulales bacterium]|nr:hypothetical protein [Pirellulales bacterium]
MGRSLSDNRPRTPRFKSKSGTAVPGQGGKGKLLLAGVVMASFVGGGWAFWHYRPDPQLLKVREMRVALEQLRDQPGLTDDQRRAQWEGFMQEVEKLSPEQRQALREEREMEREKYFDEQLKQFFALSPTEQRARLDKQIDEMEKWRKEREQRRREREASGQSGDRRGDRDGRRGGPGGPGGPGGGPRGGGPGGGSPSAIAQGGGGRPGGDGGWRGGWRNATPEQRNEWRRNRLDSSSPESRGMRAEYRRMMQERREQRGLSNNGRGWF